VSSPSGPEQPPPLLVGRDGELARLRGLVNPAPSGPNVLVLLGEAGMGKSVLLEDAERRGRAAGMRVLTVAGRESERNLAFAGLHQLLRPVADRVPDLPERQAKALSGAFALSSDPVPPDALLTGIAVLTLLSGLAAEKPLLVVADDAQWLDHASLSALAFAARRLDAEPLVLLLAARGAVPPPGFERDFAELALAPLNLRDANRLLDAQPQPPHGRAREQVLAQAAGNPMALIELAWAITADPEAGRHWAAELLPPGDRLIALIGGEFGALPAATREVLLLAAVADSPDLPASVPGLTAEALAPAEAARLIKVGRSGPEFNHPLVRAAVYYGAPFADRAAAHRVIAETVRDHPDRYAWHLAAAAMEPDEHVAALLESTAADAQRRGGAAAAARALERAAELSPGTHDRARRLVAAGWLAYAADQADWTQQMASQVITLTADPELRMYARQQIGAALVWSGQPRDALATLISVADEAAAERPVNAWDALGHAATVAYQTGHPADRQAVQTALGRLRELAQASNTATNQAWIRATIDPFGQKALDLTRLREIASENPDEPAVGAAAWLADETALAITILRNALGRLRAPGMRGNSGATLSALGWAYIDAGRWDEALAVAREAADTAAAYAMDAVAASADLTTATVAALRGDRDRVEPLLERVRATIDLTAYRGFAARAWHVAGLAALADGGYPAAFEQLRRLFAADGEPLHSHVSYLAVADLAAAAVRAEPQPEARALADNALALAPAQPGPRLAQLVARARGLLAESADAEASFRAGLGTPAGEARPFERARLQLDYGEWLRRQRRINDARPVLSAALDTFRRLGAMPWSRRAEAELRATGVTVADAPAGTGALDELTAQQREIVVLASRGLSNSEIADRLFLSPRTVESHLYRSYPKLGIAGRHQLRDLIDSRRRGG
jgi:DNA-binding CsgD family transcriptional regulator